MRNSAQTDWPDFSASIRADTGDYTRDRHRWLGGTTIDEIMAAVNRSGKHDRYCRQSVAMASRQRSVADWTD